MKAKLFDKINLIEVVRRHFATLVDDNTKKVTFGDFFLFLIIPIFLSSILIHYDKYVSDDTLNLIVAALSILVGLLFNVIVLIFDIITRDNKNELKNELLKQLLANICYTILVSIVAILFALLTASENCYLKVFSNALLYFLLFHFLFTVLMILKRMFVLFKNELDNLS